MKTLMKTFAIAFIVGITFSACSSDDNYTPATDNPVDRPFPINPDTEYAPERPTPGGPNPE